MTPLFIRRAACLQVPFRFMAILALPALGLGACSDASDPSSFPGPAHDPQTGALPVLATPPDLIHLPPSWTDFRGPGRTGHSLETGLLPEWPEDGPPLLWMAEGLGRGYGSLTLDDDRVFVQGTSDDRSSVFALDRSNGSLRWKTPIADIFTSVQGVGPNSTPVVDDGSVVALSANGTLASLDAASGTIRWSLSFPDQFDSEIPVFGYSESPLVRSGIVYAMPGGKDGAVVALKAEDGTLVWRSGELPDAASYCSLVHRNVDGVEVLLGYTAASAFGISADDGRVFFQTAESANRTANASAPLVVEPFVLYSTSYAAGGSLLMEMTRAGDRLLAEKVYFQRKMKNHYGGLVYHEGFVYGSHGNILQCMKLSDGRIRWSERGLGRSAMLLAEGLLYVYNDEGVLHLVEARPDAFRLRSRMKLQDRGAPTLGYPVILDRKLYLRDTDRLYCFDIAA